MGVVFRYAEEYIPHPKKRSFGGEDAAFYHRRALGVFDGVGGSSVHTGDAARYSRALAILTCQYTRSQGSSQIHRALEYAIAHNQNAGSSTACVIGLTGNMIHGVNIGDSKVVIIRSGRVIQASITQRHSFNCPYQVSRRNVGKQITADIFNCRVEKGDCVIMATDGLWDNMYQDSVLEVVRHFSITKSKHASRFSRRRLERRARRIAQGMAGRAFIASQDRRWFSPFAKEAGAAGVKHQGGKPDDITVLVAFVSDPAREI